MHLLALRAGIGWLRLLHCFRQFLRRLAHRQLAKQQVAATADALPLNLKGIRSSLYLASVVDFNLVTRRDE